MQAAPARFLGLAGVTLFNQEAFFWLKMKEEGDRRDWSPQPPDP